MRAGWRRRGFARRSTPKQADDLTAAGKRPTDGTRRGSARLQPWGDMAEPAGRADQDRAGPIAECGRLVPARRWHSEPIKLVPAATLPDQRDAARLPHEQDSGGYIPNAGTTEQRIAEAATGDHRQLVADAAEISRLTRSPAQVGAETEHTAHARWQGDGPNRLERSGGDLEAFPGAASAVAKGRAQDGRATAWTVWHVQAADDRDPVAQECEGDAEQGQLAGEISRAVERIQHPEVFGVGALGRPFLAQDPVVWECAAEIGADEPLDSPVDLRYGVGALFVLELDVDRSVETLQHERTGTRDDGGRHLLRLGKDGTVAEHSIHRA